MNAQRDALQKLAAYLHLHREHLLDSWHSRVAADPHITADATLAHAQFVDHIPRFLDAFEEQLRAHGRDEQAQAAAMQRESAVEHGVHRWLHGYHYKETMREWGHLQLCLAHDLEQFSAENPQYDAEAMSAARAMLTRLCVDCMVESAAGHVRLQEVEAASRLRDLEQVLTNVRALERERARLWHEAAHDLRGNVSAVQLAATALGRTVALSGGPEALHAVERTTAALGMLLEDLIELSRLEAGRESRKISRMDAAQLVREVCASFEVLAAQRRLFLRVDAPSPLEVQGDPVKIRRILQNLLQNALKYTDAGGVQVSMAERDISGIQSWELLVKDTGIGMAERSTSAIATVLRAATEEMSELEDGPGEGPISTLPNLSSDVPLTASGEGVGLTIVKRLCELLDATLEVATAEGRGTTFRILFPRTYSG